MFPYSEKVVEQVEERIKDIVHKRRLRLIEFFSQFDELRKGRVTRSQFERCLGMLGFNFSTSEFQELANKYAINHIDVDYRRFSDEITHWITNNTIVRRPSSDIIDDTQTFRNTRNQSVKEIGNFVQLWEKLKKEMRVRGLKCIETFFQDFDRHNSGKVTKTRFFRAIPFELTPEEIALLEERYAVGNIDIDYLQFSRDLGKDEIETHTQTKYIEAMPNGGSLYNPSQFTKTTTLPKELSFSSSFIKHPESPEDVEHNLKKLVLRHRIRLADAFRDFDPLRSKLITESQFASGLGSIKFPHYTITQQDIDLLISKYEQVAFDSAKQIRYQDFIDEIDSVFTKSYLEKRPRDSYVEPVYLKHDSLKALEENEECELERVLDKIRYEVKVKGILVKPFFQDFDRTSKGVYSTSHVTRTRFERVLSLMNLKLSTAEISLLCNKYEDLDDGNVNYVAFLKDVDPLYSRGVASFSTMNPVHNPPPKISQ